jgi:hypothetical protein
MAVTRFHTLLRERIEQALDSYKNDLALGIAKDYAEYKFSAGYVSGLRDTLKFCEDIEGEIDERSRPAPGS